MLREDVQYFTCLRGIFLHNVFQILSRIDIGIRNQHYIKSTLPTSTYYASPNDGPGAPEPPNFVNQFACMLWIEMCKEMYWDGFSRDRNSWRNDLSQYTCWYVKEDILCCQLYRYTDTSFQAIDFRRWIGGEEAINEYCHNLALKGGRRLADILGTAVLDENGEFTAHMVFSIF